MFAGYAAIEITPAIGSLLNGFISRLSSSTGIDAPLFARALWLEESNVTCLIISLDLLAISPSYANFMVRELSTRLNIPEDNIILACSHTHSGPMTAQLRGIGSEDKNYLSELAELICKAACLAENEKKSVKLYWGAAPVEIGINRRQYVAEEDTVVHGCNPDAPRDPAVRVMHLLGKDLSIVLFHHACHPYCLGGDYTLISPDYWGRAASALAECGHQAIYLNGCSGNLAPQRAFEGPQAARAEGRKLAGAVMVACEQARIEENTTLEMASVPFEIPYDELPSFEQIQNDLNKKDCTVRDEERACREIQRRMQKAWDEWLGDLKGFLEIGSVLPPMKARISVIRIGPGSIVALPGEVFYEIGQKIASQLYADPVCVAAYCHGYIGYVPDSPAFAKGGYEVEEAHRYVGLWRVSPCAGDLMKDQVLRLWQDLGGQLR